MNESYLIYNTSTNKSVNWIEPIKDAGVRNKQYLVGAHARTVLI